MRNVAHRQAKFTQTGEGSVRTASAALHRASAIADGKMRITITENETVARQVEMRSFKHYRQLGSEIAPL